MKNKVSPIKYEGPNIIKNDFNFLGVPIEYIFAEKLLAVTSELERPFKHLIDAYSISKININIEVLQRYLKTILDFENIIRKKLGINFSDYKYQISPNKKFIKSYYVPMFQSGYIMKLNQMIKELNEYMLKNLK